MSHSSDSIIEAAATWLVRLEVDNAAERETARADFEAWRRADPRHEQAAVSMMGLLGQLGVVSAHPATPAPAASALGRVFSQGRKERQRAGARNALMLCTVAALGWLSLTLYPPAYLMADVRTGTGEWKTIQMADGSELTLSGDSAVDVHLEAARRTVRLVRGELLVKVAPDKSRPFRVATEDGTVTALGTEFVVSRGKGETTVSMIESRTAVHPAQQLAAEDTVVSAGQQVRFTEHQASQASPIDAQALSDAWVTHSLVVEGMPLTDVLDRLARQRPGVLHYDAQALAGIKVSAVLPLDDPERSLQLLVNSLPQLRVRSLSRYLVWIDAGPFR